MFPSRSGRILGLVPGAAGWQRGSGLRPTDEAFRITATSAAVPLHRPVIQGTETGRIRLGVPGNSGRSDRGPRRSVSAMFSWWCRGP